MRDDWELLYYGSTAQIIDPANIPACFYQIRIDWAE
jgi:hypothetical protein